MKSFISYDKNVYYEAIDRLGPNDIEVPPRPSADHTFVNGAWMDHRVMNTFHHDPHYQSPAQQQTNLSDLVNVIKQLQTMNNSPAPQAPAPDTFKKETSMSNFIGDKFTWKDLITILYFAGGIVGLWMHMNERIVILEQKVVSIEKGNAELQNSFKEFTVKNENQLKSIDSKISDLQQMVITRISK